ncbi:FAD-binding oxidoreductase [Aspergillus novofumigatus IBT 16806]|uniref:Aryl-alcohol oxidase n=1 Tax=Aspergillus novofumigatus (strain IBT 16806) TaxID=1392255 RepID=A0A2I1CEE4_ASPN1|nr:aryl-alcohol oxidase [Aspergillus novofumigatus IBT 16806]PKX95992.1 aryl-alcohol oxidase [Aspergillus novofumigatus IBT 16806]
MCMSHADVTEALCRIETPTKSSFRHHGGFCGFLHVGYGGAAPRVPGSIGLDMGKNMNKVLKVDADSAYALVEPGVSFFDLHQYLVDHDLRDKVWADCPDLGGGSVIGNTMERGIGYTPYGDYWMMHCGLEVVLPDGSLVRTGMGALPNPKADKNAPPHEQEPNECWQLFNYGVGPHHDGIFSQSNMGIVTKMGVWLMPNPGGSQTYMITFPRDDDLNRIVEIMRPLRVSMVIQNVPKLDNILVSAAMEGTRSSYTESKELLTDADLDAIAEKLGLGRWNFYGCIYGPPEVREVLWKVIKGAFSQIPGAKFYFPEDRPHDKALQTRKNTFVGIPSITELDWVSWLPNGGHLFFAPIAKLTGDDAEAQYELTRRRSEEFGFDFLGAFLVGVREIHHIVCILFDREDPEMRTRAHELIKLLIQEAADRGWGEYRAHLALMDQVAGTYNFNDSAHMKLSEKIKDALDPKGILSPGKNGVWPTTYKQYIKQI